MLTRRQKRAQSSAAAPGSTLSLMDIGVDGFISVLAACLVPPAAEDGARALACLARTCRLLGLKGYLDGKGKDSEEPSIVVKIAHEACKEAGVRRFPMTMGDGWCWTRMTVEETSQALPAEEAPGRRNK
jgi:hypothetical protein